MCRLSVKDHRSVWSQLALFVCLKLAGAPVQSRSRAVRKVEPTGFYTVRQLKTALHATTQHQEHLFPVAGFPFPHIQPPSTGLLTLLKHSSMGILVFFFENPKWSVNIIGLGQQSVSAV